MLRGGVMCWVHIRCHPVPSRLNVSLCCDSPVSLFSPLFLTLADSHQTTEALIILHREMVTEPPTHTATKGHPLLTRL